MIANGVPVAFDVASVLALGLMVIGAYAAIWAWPRLFSLFR